jgi:hypothetical protein
MALARRPVRRDAREKEVVMEDYILFDVPHGEEPVDRQFLEQLGHRVMVCPGPEQGTPCPILTGEGCALAEGAHGIVFELDLDEAQHRAILSRYKESLRSDVPVRVVVRPGQAEKYSDVVKGLKVLTHEPVAGDLDALAAEVEAADGP